MIRLVRREPDAGIGLGQPRPPRRLRGRHRPLLRQQRGRAAWVSASSAPATCAASIRAPTRATRHDQFAGGSGPRRLGGALPAAGRRVRAGAVDGHRRGRALHRRVPARARRRCTCGPARSSTDSPTCRSPASAASPASISAAGRSTSAEIMLKRVFDADGGGDRPRVAVAAARGDRGGDQARQPGAGLLPPEALRLQPAALRRLQVPIDAGGCRRGRSARRPATTAASPGSARSSGAPISTSCRSS